MLLLSPSCPTSVVALQLHRVTSSRSRRAFIAGSTGGVSSLLWKLQTPAANAASTTPISKALSLSTGEDAKKFVQSKIDHNKVMVFSKSYCPYCKRTKALLTYMQQQQNQQVDFVFEYIDLDLLPGKDGPIIQYELLKLTDQTTVPNIFIGNTHIGGDSDLYQLYTSGKLLGMLKELSD